MKQLLIRLAIISVFIVSCNKTDKNDLSYSSEEYVKMGIPDYKKIWTSEDYIDAFTALNKLKLMKPKSLPRKNSAKSGAYFDRMLSEENFSFLQNDKLSNSEKAHQIQYYAGIQNELIRIYTNGLSKDRYYHSELVEFNIFGLNVSQKKLDLAFKIMDSENPEDKSLQYGLKSVYRGYMEMVIYILNNQNNLAQFTEEDLGRLSEVVSKSLVNNKTWVKKTDDGRIIQKLQEVVDETTIPEVKDNYQNIIDSW